MIQGSQPRFNWALLDLYLLMLCNDLKHTFTRMYWGNSGTEPAADEGLTANILGRTLRTTHTDVYV